MVGPDFSGSAHVYVDFFSSTESVKIYAVCSAIQIFYIFKFLSKLLTMKYLPCFFIFLLAFCISCNTPIPLEIPDVPVTYSVEPDKAGEYSLADLVTDVEYVELKLPQGTFLGALQKAIFADSSIYLLDVVQGSGISRILVLSNEGIYRFAIDKTGKGPGEYEFIYDFDVTEKFIVVSSADKFMFYDKDNGAFVQSFNKPEECPFDNIVMLNEITVISDAGRTRYNRDKEQIRIWNVDEGEFVYEGVPFRDFALKLGNTSRYFFRLQDTVRAMPIYSKTVYSVVEEQNKYSIEPAYTFDFGKYWIDANILANSYNERELFFGSAEEYVHTVDVFETDEVIYVHYRLQNKDFAYLLDKATGRSLNISDFTDNDTGWIGSPITTDGDWIVNVITPFQLEESGIVPNKELEKMVVNYSDEGQPVLVKAKFQIN